MALNFNFGWISSKSKKFIMMVDKNSERCKYQLQLSRSKQRRSLTLRSQSFQTIGFSQIGYLVYLNIELEFHFIQSLRKYHIFFRSRNLCEYLGSILNKLNKTT